MLEFKMPRTHRKKSLVLLAIALLIIELILSLFINLIRGRTQSTLTYFLVSPHTNYAALVDPFTGTSVQNGAPFGGGGTFPGADVPSGMVQWSPDTVNPRPGGYAYNDHRIKGFSLTHLRGAGCATYQDFSFMP